MDQSTILDGLAWASYTESARIAIVTNRIVSDMASRSCGVTKTQVKGDVKATYPPYGRGKAVFEAIWGVSGVGGGSGELDRQVKVHFARREARLAWEAWLIDQARLATRINNAYAAAFSRPTLTPTRAWPGGSYYSKSPDRDAWEAVEEARDKGDDCEALTHQGGYVVALLSKENGKDRTVITTRRKRGPIVRTYLRYGGYRGPDTLTQAAIMLGGTKAQAAFAKGKRVQTDWVGRRTLIHHDGSDYILPQVEIIPWLTAHYDDVDKRVKTTTLGTDVQSDGVEEDEDY